VVLSGYGALYFDPQDEQGTQYVMSTPWGDTIIERLQPGVFSRAIREDDVAGLVNHNMDNLLGRTSAGTMRLYSDARGLIYEIDCDAASPTVQSFLSAIRRGDLRGSSFCFSAEQVIWREAEHDGVVEVIRELVSVHLHDTGPVLWPAYTSTTCSVSESQRSRPPASVYHPRDTARRNPNGKAKRLRVLQLGI
jgi:HK97 family phage prohead protease